MADEDVVIAIDAPEDVVTKVEGEKPAKVEPKAGDTKVAKADDEGIETLRTQLEGFKTRATASDAEAARQREAAESARQALHKAKGEVVDSQMSAVDSAIVAAEAEETSAMRDYQTAFDAADGAKAAEAQKRMARASAKVMRLQESKADLEAAPKRTEQPERVERQQHADPFEAQIASATPRSQAWLRGHRDYVTDPKLNMKAQAAHLDAVSEGFIPDTDAYFDFCERKLGLKQDDPEPNPKPRTTARKSVMTSAPVSRDASSSNGNGGAGQVTLTPGEQRAATDGTIVHNFDDPSGKFKKGDPIGLREFAKRKHAMQAEGRYSGNYTEQ